MYQINELLEARLQDLRRKRQQLAQYRDLPYAAGLGQGLRRSAGDALISLGTWIKPDKRNANLGMHPVHLAGR